jgi:CRISPR-associated protein Csb2
MLALEVEYLVGRVFAGTFRDRSEPEWPPHPSRLYTALAAAYFEADANESERRALEWLERQGPPLIRAGRAGEPLRAVAYVPTNYIGDGPPAIRGKQPRVFAAQGPSEATVHFIWASAEPDPQIATALDALASRTGYLGKAASLIRMCVTDAAPEANWIPDPSGTHALRVARQGRLAELEGLFTADQRPTAGPQQKYRCTDDKQPRTEAVESVFGEMLVFRKTSGVGLPIEAALTLTDAVRTAILSNAGGGGPIPDIINGHGETPHIAVIGLPFVGTEHADGHLLGFAVVLPRSAGPEDRRAVRAACARLQAKGVHLPGVLGNWTVEVELSPLAQALLPRTWNRASLRWASVTPILLDRFPSKKGPTVEEILRKSCERSGLPEPEIEHSPYSKVPGVPPVPQFRLLRKREERARWGVHAELKFPVPVKGPVLLGAGRFFGMGLMKPIETGDD